MADYLPAFQLEIMTAMNAVWSEIILPGGGSTSNFFTAIQALKKNIEVRMADGDPAMPYAFLAIGVFPPGNFTSDRNEKNGGFTIFYLDSEKNGATQTTINAKLQLFDEYIRTHTFNTFRQIADATIDSSDLNPIMSTLRTASGVAICGGIITFPNNYVAALS